MHLSVKTEPNIGNNETVMVANNLTPPSSAVGPNADLAMAMNNLSLQFKEHVETTERRFDDFGEAISVMSSNRGGRANRGSYIEEVEVVFEEVFVGILLIVVEVNSDMTIVIMTVAVGEDTIRDEKGVIDVVQLGILPNSVVSRKTAEGIVSRFRS